MKLRLSFIISLSIALAMASNITQAATLDCNSASNINVPVTECQALLDLYDSTAGTNRTNNSNRDTDTDICAWYGVSCTNIAGQERVGYINLQNNNLIGTLPDSLSNLDKIITFSVSSNGLSGILHDSRSSRSSIDYFTIEGNQIGGTLPSSRSNWSNITRFFVGQNAIGGVLPDSRQSRNTIKQFSIQNNRIKGNLPSGYSNWSSIEEFVVWDNFLSGDIPTGYTNRNNIHYIALNRNCLDTVLTDPPATFINTWAGTSRTLDQNNCSSDLSISSHIPDSYNTKSAGDSVSYTIYRENAGPRDTNNTIITHTIGTGVVAYIIDNPGRTEVSSGVYQYNLGTVAASTNGQVSFTGYVTLDTPAPNYCFESTISADYADTNPGNNTRNDNCIQVESYVDLTINTSIISPLIINPGDYITYLLSYHNIGNIGANNVILADIPMTGLTIISSNVPYTAVLRKTYGTVGDSCFDNMVDSTSGPYVDALNTRAINGCGVADFQHCLEDNIPSYPGGSNRGAWRGNNGPNELGASNFIQVMEMLLANPIDSIDSSCGFNGTTGYEFSLGTIDVNSGGTITITGQVALTGFDIGQTGVLNTANISTSSQEASSRTYNNTSRAFSPFYIGYCGDNIINNSEQCDDGNTLDGDGCTSSCQIGPVQSCSVSGCFVTQSRLSASIIDDQYVGLDGTGLLIRLINNPLIPSYDTLTAIKRDIVYTWTSTGSINAGYIVNTGVNSMDYYIKSGSPSFLRSAFFSSTITTQELQSGLETIGQLHTNDGFIAVLPGGDIDIITGSKILTGTDMFYVSFLDHSSLSGKYYKDFDNYDSSSGIQVIRDFYNNSLSTGSYGTSTIVHDYLTEDTKFNLGIYYNCNVGDTDCFRPEDIAPALKHESHIEYVYQCVGVCGNGYLEEGEQCDDGNTNNGDSCSSSCQIEHTGGSGFAGGGGSPHLVVDVCPDGDHSPSYYDHICDASTTTGTQATGTIIPQTTPTTCPYTDGEFQLYKQTLNDIPAKGKLRDSVNKLLDLCAIHGRKNEGTSFDPYASITYGEMYKIATRSLGLDLSTNNYHHKLSIYYQTAKKNGLLKNIRYHSLDANVNTEDAKQLLLNILEYTQSSPDTKIRIYGDTVSRAEFSKAITYLLDPKN